MDLTSGGVVWRCQNPPNPNNDCFWFLLNTQGVRQKKSQKRHKREERFIWI